MALAVEPITPPNEADAVEHSPTPYRTDIVRRLAQQYRRHAVRALTLREYGNEVLELNNEQASALNRVGNGQYLSVEPEGSSGLWRVFAHNYVGSVNVAGLQVLVRPKIPLRNLFSAARSRPAGAGLAR